MPRLIPTVASGLALGLVVYGGAQLMEGNGEALRSQGQKLEQLAQEQSSQSGDLPGKTTIDTGKLDKLVGSLHAMGIQCPAIESDRVALSKDDPTSFLCLDGTTATATEAGVTMTAVTNPNFTRIINLPGTLEKASDEVCNTLSYALRHSAIGIIGQTGLTGNEVRVDVLFGPPETRCDTVKVIKTPKPNITNKRS